MKKAIALLLTSTICKWIFRKIFFVHGSYIEFRKGGLKGMFGFWDDLSIINDVYLNVAGKRLLNQRLSKNEVFGNRLMTISAAMHLAELEEAGEKWEKRINRLEADHFEKAFLSHKQNITNEYNRLNSL